MNLKVAAVESDLTDREVCNLLVASNNGKMVPVPNNMTNHFQPLDLTVNRICKAFLRKQTQEWFFSEVQTQIQNGVKPENVKVDLRISVLKPLQAKWVTSFYDKIQSRQDIVKKKPGKEQVSRKSLWTSQSKILLKIRFIDYYFCF